MRTNYWFSACSLERCSKLTIPDFLIFYNQYNHYMNFSIEINLIVLLFVSNLFKGIIWNCFFTNSKASSLVRFHHLIQTEIALPEPARLRTYMHWLYTPTFMNNPTYSWQWVAKKLTHSFARHSAYKFYNEDSLTHARKLFSAEGKNCEWSSAE